MIKLYTGCLVLLIGNLIVGQVVLTFKIVKYDKNMKFGLRLAGLLEILLHTLLSPFRV